MKRSDFPFLKKYTYLDTAAGSLKPKQVVDAISDFYLKYPINPHSIDSSIGVELYKKVIATRESVATFLSASSNEIIFTSGTTDSLNKIAIMLKSNLNEGDEILISPTNHASAVVPFMEIAKSKKAKIVVDLDLLNNITNKTKIIIYAQQDNAVNNNIVDIKKLFNKANKVGAILINDAAQAVAHETVSLEQSHVIVFSSNKLYGPTGTGVLAVKHDLLKTLKPVTFGGGATSNVNQASWKGKGAIGDYEPGTINTAGIIGLGAAIKYFQKLKEEGFLDKEKILAVYAYHELEKIEGIKIFSQKGDINILFNIKEFNAQDIVSYLGHKNIILRAGKHCAHMLNTVIKCESSIRLSIGGYNNESDIDTCIKALKNGGDFLGFL